MVFPLFLLGLCLFSTGQDNGRDGVASERVPSVPSLEREVLDHRRRIQKADIEFDSEYCVDQSCRSGNHMHTVGRYYLDGKKKRIDRTILSGSVTMTGFKETICFGESTYIYHTNLMAGDYPVSVNMFDFGHVNTSLVSARVPDARILGMAPAALGNLIYYNLESFIGRADEKNAVVFPSTHKGIPCWLLQYNTFDKFRTQLTIVPSMDYSVVRFEMLEYDNPESAPQRAIVKTNSVDTEMARDQASGLWFPKRVNYRTFVKGELQTEERLTLNVKSLNQELDSSDFTLATMDVKPGTHIQRIPASDAGELYWDGASIQVKDASGNVVTPPPPRARGYRRFFIANAVIFAIVAVYLLVRVFSRKVKQ